MELWYILKSFIWKEKGTILTFCSPLWWRRTSNHILFRILLKVLISIINWSKYDFPFHSAISANYIYSLPWNISEISSSFPWYSTRRRKYTERIANSYFCTLKSRKFSREWSCNLKEKVFETFSGWEFRSKSYYSTNIMIIILFCSWYSRFL